MLFCFVFVSKPFLIHYPTSKPSARNMFMIKLESWVFTQLSKLVVTLPMSWSNRVTCVFPVVPSEPATKLGRWRNVGDKSTTYGDTHDPGYQMPSAEAENHNEVAIRAAPAEGQVVHKQMLTNYSF